MLLETVLWSLACGAPVAVIGVMSKSRRIIALIAGLSALTVLFIGDPFASGPDLMGVAIGTYLALLLIRDPLVLPSAAPAAGLHLQEVQSAPPSIEERIALADEVYEQWVVTHRARIYDPRHASHHKQVIRKAISEVFHAESHPMNETLEADFSELVGEARREFYALMLEQARRRGWLTGREIQAFFDGYDRAVTEALAKRPSAKPGFQDRPSRRSAANAASVWARPSTAAHAMRR